MKEEIRLLEEHRRQALERAEAQYQETKDNERYKWAVDTINKKYECEKEELSQSINNQRRRA